MFWKKIRKGRILISYRRSDAQGVADRLSDSLENYFGGDRFFWNRAHHLHHVRAYEYLRL